MVATQKRVSKTAPKEAAPKRRRRRRGIKITAKVLARVQEFIFAKGSTSTTTLAKAIGLSPNAAKRALTTLQKQGVVIANGEMRRRWTPAPPREAPTHRPKRLTASPPASSLNGTLENIEQAAKALLALVGDLKTARDADREKLAKVKALLD